MVAAKPSSVGRASARHVGLHPQGVGRGCKGLKPQQRTLKPDLQSSRLSPQFGSLNSRLSAGFTLIEMIMVIVITGILGGIIATVLKAPVQQFVDVSRRAEMTDIADTALYRLASEISSAVPNSIRVAGCGTTPCVEFLPTLDGGRYRASAAGGAGLCGLAGDELDFTTADTCFEIIGPPVTFAAGDRIVLGSTQSNGNPPYDATAAGVLRAYTGAVGAQASVSFTGTQFPLFAALPSQRFDVVPGDQQAVTYACEGTLGVVGGNGQGQLVKRWGYGFNVAQAAPSGLGGSSAILADKVSACVIDYDTSNQRMGLLGVRLTLTSGDEQVSLYHEIHVNNTP
ncbi:MAG: type II secretion system protein [Gallionella sp.]|nr:type II secretion system protein [Gallionella sp.]